jgi:hypothetical protein
LMMNHGVSAVTRVDLLCVFIPCDIVPLRCTESHTIQSPNFHFQPGVYTPKLVLYW